MAYSFRPGALEDMEASLARMGYDLGRAERTAMLVGKVVTTAAATAARSIEVVEEAVARFQIVEDFADRLRNVYDEARRAVGEAERAFAARPMTKQQADEAIALAARDVAEEFEKLGFPIPPYEELVGLVVDRTIVKLPLPEGCLRNDGIEWAEDPDPCEWCELPATHVARTTLRGKGERRIPVCEKHGAALGDQALVLMPIRFWKEYVAGLPTRASTRREIAWAEKAFSR